MVLRFCNAMHMVEALVHRGLAVEHHGELLASHVLRRRNQRVFRVMGTREVAEEMLCNILHVLLSEG